jgi:predicted GIY-YIG superfamily endonuclease
MVALAEKESNRVMAITGVIFFSRIKYISMNTNHPRTFRQAQGKFFTTNFRQMPAHIRVFVTPFMSTPTVHVALERERQIKGRLRAKKIALIDSMNPEWKDLSEEWCT